MVVVPRLFEVLRQRILKQVEKQGKLTNYLMGRALSIGAKDYRGRVPLWDKPMDLFLEPDAAAQDRGQVRRPDQGDGLGRRAAQSRGRHLLPFARPHPAAGLWPDRGGAGASPATGRSVGLKMDTVGPPLDEHRGEDRRGRRDPGPRRAGHARLLAQRGGDRADADRTAGCTPATSAISTSKGRIVITDRKKDLIVNDKGDNVAPQKVEGMLTLQPEIVQAMVAGDKRPYLVGLIVPDPEWTADWCAANKRNCHFDELAHDPDYVKALSAAVDRVNQELSVIEKVRRFIVADEPFTVENEKLTPSIKIRRHVIKEVYGERLDALYKR